MKRQFSAGIIVYHNNGGEIRYLLLHYPGGHWDFPKGKIEEGEQKEQTARRELKEETGLETVEILPGFEDHVEYFFRVKDDLYFKEVTFFLGKVDRTSIIISHEHRAYKWLDFKQAYERITYQNSKDVLKRADQFLAHYPKSL